MDLIKDIIVKGLLGDLKIAERSFRLNKKIKELGKADLETSKKDISEILRDLSYTEMVLSLARIYDNPNKKYPTRCLKRLYQVVKEADFQIDLKNYRSDSVLNLQYFGFDSIWIELLAKSYDIDFNRRTVGYFETQEVNEPLYSYIGKIKEVRDKLLAHNEDATVDSLIPYASFESLLEHAKNVVSFYSLTYTGIRLKFGSDYYLADSTRNWENMYQEFIES